MARWVSGRGLAAEGAFRLELRQKCVRVVLVARLFAFPSGFMAICRRFGQLLVEFPPLLLGPAELLYGRGEIEEVHGDDVRPGPEIGVPDEGIQLPPGLQEALVDLL